MAHFAATKLELELHFVPLVQKLFRMPHFSQVIVWIDVHPEFDFFQLRCRRFLLFVLLGEIVSVFSEIDDLADRWVCRGRDFHQVEPE
jgi:hypothetical protein